MDEKDIWRSAQAVIKAQRDGAIAYADARIRHFTHQGAHEGANVWKRIRTTIEAVQNDTHETVDW